MFCLGFCMLHYSYYQWCFKDYVHQTLLVMEILRRHYFSFQFFSEILYRESEVSNKKSTISSQAEEKHMYTLSSEKWRFQSSRLGKWILTIVYFHPFIATACASPNTVLSLSHAKLCHSLCDNIALNIRISMTRRVH